MSNQIKPVAWIRSGKVCFGSQRPYYWGECDPLYDKSAIDRLTEERDSARGTLAHITSAFGNEQLSRFIAKHGDPVPLLVQIEELTAQLAEHKADAERYRWIRLRIGGAEAIADDFKWEYQSGECLAQEVDAAIDAARKGVE